jgi:hypothetical protein
MEDAARHEVTLRTLSPVWEFAPFLMFMFFPVPAFISVMTAHPLPALLWFAVMGLFGAGVVLWGSARVLVGSDGVLIRRVGRERFVPFAAVRAVKEVRHGNALRFDLRSGGRVELYTGKEDRAGIEGYLDRYEVLLERIRQGIAAVAAADLAARERQAESLIARAGAPAAAGYRAAEAPESDALWDLVADGAAPPGARAAAAQALRGTGTDAAPRLLRIAAETARPALGAFLRIAADGSRDDAEIAAALDEVMADDERQARRLPRRKGRPPGRDFG